MGKAVKLQISDSTIGLLNTGEISHVETLTVNVSTLEETGHPEVAEALVRISEAVAESEELSQNQRQEALEQLAELSRQATLAPEERSATGVLRALSVGIATTLGAAGGLAEVWSTWGTAIEAFFGL